MVLYFYGHREILDIRRKGHRPSCVSYTILINGYCKVDNVRTTQKLLDEMVEDGIRLNSLTYSALIGEFFDIKIGEGEGIDSHALGSNELPRGLASEQCSFCESH